MKPAVAFRWIVGGFLLAAWMGPAPLIGADAAGAGEAAKSFRVRGVVRDIKRDAGSVVIAHEAIPVYMPAMTMPFDVSKRSLLAGVQPGDPVMFQLRVTEEAGWIDEIQRLGVAPAGLVLAGNVAPPGPSAPPVPTLAPVAGPTATAGDPLAPVASLALPDLQSFTNELGRPVLTEDFRGKALGITFIFTRCPIPNYCPRLTKNFQEACDLLSARRDGPTNWHFLSVTMDPDHDTPGVL
jgi:protein SCO1/2